MYRFAAEPLDLNLAAVTTPDGKIDESHATIEKVSALHVFTADSPIPPTTLHDATAIERTFASLQN